MNITHTQYTLNKTRPVYFEAVLPEDKAGALWLLLRGIALFAAEESCSRTIGMSGLLSLNSELKTLPYS